MAKFTTVMIYKHKPHHLISPSNWNQCNEQALFSCDLPNNKCCKICLCLRPLTAPSRLQPWSSFYSTDGLVHGTTGLPQLCRMNSGWYSCLLLQFLLINKCKPKKLPNFCNSAPTSILTTSANYRQLLELQPRSTR